MDMSLDAMTVTTHRLSNISPNSPKAFMDDKDANVDVDVGLMVSGSSLSSTRAREQARPAVRVARSQLDGHFRAESKIRWGDHQSENKRAARYVSGDLAKDEEKEPDLASEVLAPRGFQHK